MSYARFGERDSDGKCVSDVYVYPDVSGPYVCCGCLLYGSHSEETPAGMIEHLREHFAAGHCVPVRAFDALAMETLAWKREKP